MLDVPLEMALLLTSVGAVAGFVDAIAGGGGLLTMPALLFAGLNPAQAVATNKLQGSFGTFAAVRFFIKRDLLQPHLYKKEIASVLLGAALGAIGIQLVEPSFLKSLMPWILVVVAVYFLVTPAIGTQQGSQRLATSAMMMVLLSIGFYDGFFGPGTGTFFALALIVLQGTLLTEATAQAKLYNFTSNIVSLALFIVGGEVVWSLGLLMAIGQLLGARLGAGMVITRGVGIIRPITIMMCLAMSVTLILRG